MYYSKRKIINNTNFKSNYSKKFFYRQQIIFEHINLVCIALFLFMNWFIKFDFLLQRLSGSVGRHDTDLDLLVREGEAVSTKLRNILTHNLRSPSHEPRRSTVSTDYHRHVYIYMIKPDLINAYINLIQYLSYLYPIFLTDL